jgi:predicted DNA-binding protein
MYAYNKGVAMKRTTIMIPVELKKRATERARQMGMSLGGFIRESLENAIEAQNENSAGDAEDAFFDDETVYSGETPIDLSANHDKYLYDPNDSKTIHGNH